LARRTISAFIPQNELRAGNTFPERIKPETQGNLKRDLATLQALLLDGDEDVD
jgi:hypothetical protein